MLLDMQLTSLGTLSVQSTHDIVAQCSVGNLFPTLALDIAKWVLLTSACCRLQSCFWDKDAQRR